MDLVWGELHKLYPRVDWNKYNQPYYYDCLQFDSDLFFCFASKLLDCGAKLSIYWNMDNGSGWNNGGDHIFNLKINDTFSIEYRMNHIFESLNGETIYPIKDVDYLLHLLEIQNDIIIPRDYSMDIMYACGHIKDFHFTQLGTFINELKNRKNYRLIKCDKCIEAEKKAKVLSPISDTRENGMCYVWYAPEANLIKIGKTQNHVSTRKNMLKAKFLLKYNLLGLSLDTRKQKSVFTKT